MAVFVRSSVCVHTCVVQHPGASYYLWTDQRGGNVGEYDVPKFTDISWRRRHNIRAASRHGHLGRLLPHTTADPPRASTTISALTAGEGRKQWQLFGNVFGFSTGHQPFPRPLAAASFRLRHRSSSPPVAALRRPIPYFLRGEGVQGTIPTDLSIAASPPHHCKRDSRGGRGGL